MGTASAVRAQVPPPISSGMFSLPGAYQQPPSAAAAGMALANEWLGDSPYSNPAVPRGNGLIVSPVLLRVSRQDLRAGNHNVGVSKAEVADMRFTCLDFEAGIIRNTSLISGLLSF